LRFRYVLLIERPGRAGGVDGCRIEGVHSKGAHRAQIAWRGHAPSALEESPKKLHVDHENAKFLANGLAKIKGIALDYTKVVTNIVIFDVRGAGCTAAEITSELGKEKILCGPTDKYSIRMVTHCDVQRDGIEKALGAVGEILSVRAPAAAHS
jgi:threonine aldolase